MLAIALGDFILQLWDPQEIINRQQTNKKTGMV